MTRRYRDRLDAARELAPLLEHLADQQPVVLGVPRGGVPIAVAIARHLGAPVDVILTRKLPIPHAPEVAMGVIGEDGVAWYDPDTMNMLHLDQDDLRRIEAQALATLDRYAQLLRRVVEPTPLEGRTVILVDDGLATGATLRGAIRLCRNRGAAHVVVAAPVASRSAAARVAQVADEVVCPCVDPDFRGVGGYYDDFHQLDDDEVLAALRVGE